jgi:hypothetical protein
MSLLTENPDFGIVDVSPVDLARVLQIFLDRGSQLTGVPLDSISLSVFSLPPNPIAATLTDLLNSGMKFFDAVIWLSAGRPNTHQLREDPSIKKEDLPLMNDVARSIFYIYFNLVTQARYPAGRYQAEKVKIANFLIRVMQMDQPQEYYVDMVCSFDIRLLDPRWIEFVNFQGFGQQVQSRFGLGVAGYRWFAIFKHFQPDTKGRQDLIDAIKFVNRINAAPYDWNIHPLTRPGEVIAQCGPLNGNLMNLALEVLSSESLAAAVDSRMIFSYPVATPQHNQYKLWNDQMVIVGSRPVFK